MSQIDEIPPTPYVFTAGPFEGLTPMQAVNGLKRHRGISDNAQHICRGTQPYRPENKADIIDGPNFSRR